MRNNFLIVSESLTSSQLPKQDLNVVVKENTVSLHLFIWRVLRGMCGIPGNPHESSLWSLRMQECVTHIFQLREESTATSHGWAWALCHSVASRVLVETVAIVTALLSSVNTGWVVSKPNVTARQVAGFSVLLLLIFETLSHSFLLTLPSFKAQLYCVYVTWQIKTEFESGKITVTYGLSCVVALLAN